MEDTSKLRFRDKFKAFSTKMKDKFKGTSTRPATPDSLAAPNIMAHGSVSMPSLGLDSAGASVTALSMTLPGQVVKPRPVEADQDLGQDAVIKPVSMVLPSQMDSAELPAGESAKALSSSVPDTTSQSHTKDDLAHAGANAQSSQNQLMASGVPDLVISNPLPSNPVSSDSFAPKSAPPQSHVTTALAITRDVIKTSLKFIGPFLDGLPIPAAKGIVETTLKIIELSEKIQGNNEAFDYFAGRCSLLQDTLRASISGKNVDELPKELLESIGWLALQLNDILKPIVAGRPGALGMVFQTDDYTSLIQQANIRLEQMLQIFWVKNHIACRLALQDMISNLGIQQKGLDSGLTQLQDIITAASNEISQHVISERIKQLKVAQGASYDSYKDKEHKRTPCFKGTRANLLDEISNWFTGQGSLSPIYILDGIAGIGKSTVAQTIAEQADKIHLLGASFFFSRNDEELKSGRLFFYTLAYQLACYDQSIATQIAQALENQPAYGTQKNLQKQFTTLILEPLSRVSLEQRPLPILIVIDALDECDQEDAQDLLSLLAEHISQLPQLKIFITCRPEGHIQDQLATYTTYKWFHLHDIDKSIVENDIHQYLQYYLSQQEVHKALPRLKPMWTPTPNQIQDLVNLSGKLFIIASTAVRFILDKQHRNPPLQLQKLLDNISSPTMALEPTLVMDKIYAHILCAAIPCDTDLIPDQDWLDQYQIVLGTIVVLQMPLSCNSLSELLGIEPGRVDTVLSNLHSLVAPTFTTSTDNPVFQVHHKSFPDFLTNVEQITRALKTSKNQIKISSHELHINSTMRHLELAKLCFRVMETNLLSWNSCSVPATSWYKSQNSTHVSMPQAIIYACSYWISHLLEAKLDAEVIENLEQWASIYFLTWLQVVCYTRGPSFACAKMITLQQIMPSHLHQVGAIVQDGCRMVQRNIFALTELSPMHIYWSGLPFLPQETVLYQTYHQQMQQRPSLILGGQKMWNQTIAILPGHTDYVECVAFTPDGSQLASGSDDFTIRLWDAYSGDQAALLRGHTGYVYTVAFSLVGALLASGSSDNTIRLWNIKSGSCIATLLGHTNQISSVVFSPEGFILASGSNDHTVRVWNTRDFCQITSLEGHRGFVKCVAFSQDGSVLASGAGDNTIRLWDAKSWTQITTLEGHSDWVRSVAFSPDQCTLASGSGDKTIKLWNIKSGINIATLQGHYYRLRAVAFSLDGCILASASGDSTVKLWDTTQAHCLVTLKGHSKCVKSIAFSPTHHTLASASDDKTVRLWDITSRQLQHLIKAESEIQPLAQTELIAEPKHQRGVIRKSKKVLSVAISPDGCILASASAGSLGVVVLWNIKTSSHFATLEGHSKEVRCCVFSPDGSMVASGSEDNMIMFWNAKLGIHLSTLKTHSGTVYCLAFSPDTTRLASGSADHTVKLWDVKACTLLAELKGHINSIASIAFFPDGTKLASGSQDKTIRLWDVQSGDHIATFKPPNRQTYCITLSPDGSKLAANFGGNVAVWNTLDGKQLWNFKGLSNNISYLFGVHMTSTHMYAIARAEKPKFWSLVVFKVEGDRFLDPVPLILFPPDMPGLHTCTVLTVNGVASKVAVGCDDGQVLALDISNVVLP